MGVRTVCSLSRVLCQVASANVYIQATSRSSVGLSYEGYIVCFEEGSSRGDVCRLWGTATAESENTAATSVEAAESAEASGSRDQSHHDSGLCPEPTTTTALTLALTALSGALSPLGSQGVFLMSTR